MPVSAIKTARHMQCAAIGLGMSAIVSKKIPENEMLQALLIAHRVAGGILIAVLRRPRPNHRVH